MDNMEQKEAKLKKNIADGKKSLSATLKTQKNAVAGVIDNATRKKSFMSSATTRNHLYADLLEQYKHLNEELKTWTINGVKTTGKQFFEYAKGDLPRSAGRGSFDEFSKKYFDDIVGEINPAAVKGSVAINAQVGGMAQKDIAALRAAVSTTIAEGAVEGLTNAEMQAKLKKRIDGKVGQFAFVDAAGKTWNADTYFGMLNRTLHANAARNTYITAATNVAGYDLYKIEGGVTGSSADNPRDPCDDWAGRTISMTGSTKGYDTYSDALIAGVFHPNCIHFVRALLPSEVKGAPQPKAKAPTPKPKPKVKKPKNNLSPIIVGNPSLKFQQDIQEVLDRVPPHIAEKLEKGGFEFKAAEKLIDARPDLKGVHPRGWPAGTTWEHAEGLNQGGKIVISETRKQVGGGYIKSDRIKYATGHEVGHAIDGVWKIKEDAEVIRLWKEAKKAHGENKTLKYFFQKGDAGVSETVAELTGEILRGIKTDKLPSGFDPIRIRIEELIK